MTATATATADDLTTALHRVTQPAQAVPEITGDDILAAIDRGELLCIAPQDYDILRRAAAASISAAVALAGIAEIKTDAVNTAQPQLLLADGLEDALARAEDSLGPINAPAPDIPTA